MPKPRTRQAPVATPDQPVRSVGRRPPEASPYWQHAATKLPPLTPPRSQPDAGYAPITGGQSPAPGFGREGEGAAAAHVDRAPMSFFSPPRSERTTRHNHFVFSPSSDFPKSPIPLFMASPGRQRDAGAAAPGHGVLASPGMLFDPISRLASPMGALLPSSSDLPAPGMQLGGVPRGFGSPKEQSAGGGEALQLPATGDMPGSARVARRRFTFGEPLCSAAVTRQNSAPDLLRGGSGALRGEHRGAAALSRLVETAAMHSMHPAAPMPPPSGQLLEPPPALQLDSVAVPAAAEAAAAAAAAADATQHGDDGPTPRSSSRVRNKSRGIRAAAAASGDVGVPVGAATWSSLMDAVATTPAARRLSTSTSGAKSSILSVIPPDTPDDGPAAGNARRQSTASSMMTASKHCHCKKSKCLKLYCDCFAAGLYCTNCQCTACANTIDNEEAVAAARKGIEERNPDAFKAKIVAAGDGAAGAAHRRGCHCKKSGCKKKYCECFQAGAPCSQACKCENCQNQPAPGAQPPDLPESVVTTTTTAAGRRSAPGPARGGSGAKSLPFASPSTPSLQPRPLPAAAAGTPSVTPSLTASASTASQQAPLASPPAQQPPRPSRQRRQPSPQPALPAPPVQPPAPQQQRGVGAVPPAARRATPSRGSLLPEAFNLHVAGLAPAANAPDDLDTVLVTSAAADAPPKLEPAECSPSGSLPSAAPSLPPGLPAGSRMVDTADGPMMLVPILPPSAPAQADASRSSEGGAGVEGGPAAPGEDAALAGQEALLPMIWQQLPGGRMVPVPLQSPGGEQLSFMVSPPTDDGQSDDATQHAPTPSTLFASLSVDASGNLQATGSLPPASQPMPDLQQGDELGELGSPHRRLASPHRRFFISSPVRGMVSPLRGMVQFTEVDGEDGIDLQALLGAAADLEEAGDGTSRHSLDLPAGYDFEAGDLSQSPAQENLQGTDAAVAAAATQPSNAATDTAAQLQPQKPLCDITATADSPHRGSKVRRQPCSPTASERSNPASPARSTPGKRKREDVPVHRGPLLGRFAAVAQAIEVAAQPAGERHRG